MRPLLASLALLALLALAGCSADNASPAGAVKAFRAAMASLEADKAYALLAPATQKQLKSQAGKATLQTGGRHQLKPEEMLLLGLLQPKRKVDKVEVVEEGETRARVKLTSGGKGEHSEELELVKVQGGWRILLKL